MSWSLTVSTPIGPFHVTGGEALTTARFTDGPTEGAPPDLEAALEAWFAGDLGALDAFSLAPAGTPYQQRVWKAVQAIPAGETRSYGALAHDLGSVARAVGSANASNPLALFVPCHRVVGGDGALTGYAWGVDRKRWLLDHEAGRPSLFQ